MEQSVVAAVIERDGEYLLCQRAPGKRYGGLWEFPGGKVLPGESLLEAARRELREELGVGVKGAGEVRFSVPDPGSGYIIEFVDVIIHGEPTRNEHTRIAWVPVLQLKEHPLAPADARFVDDLVADGDS